MRRRTMSILLAVAAFGLVLVPHVGASVKTLEDLFGDTGNTFQASIGFINFEGTATNQAQQSYGIAIDDLVVKWREVSLELDDTDCAVSGHCATIELATSNVFEGQTIVTVTVLETTPDAENDCDLDGTPDGTNDCNGNAVPDVVVKVASEVDVEGEVGVESARRC